MYQSVLKGLAFAVDSRQLNLRENKKTDKIMPGFTFSGVGMMAHPFLTALETGDWQGASECPIKVPDGHIAV